MVEANGNRGIAVLSCQGVSKLFPIYDSGSTWKLLLGNLPPTQVTTALRDVTLSVPKGKIVGVIGRNGSGKSTLLRILGGNYTPTSGSTYKVGSLSGLFELGGVGNQYLTGVEYANRLLALAGAKTTQIKSLIEDIREFSELGPDFERHIYTYSAGMAARLYFATATALSYDIYLIDELLSVGDAHFQNKCWQRIRSKLADGASGVLVTHDIESLLKLCSESYLIEYGRIVDFGPSIQIVRKYLNLSDERFIEGAKFVDPPSIWEAYSGEDTDLNLTIEITKPTPVGLGYAIEFLRVGEGWEPLLQNNHLFISDQVGIHKIRLSIPKLPLTVGTYEFSLALHETVKSDSLKPVNYEVYDALGWCTNRPLKLVVQGKNRGGIAILPMVCKKLEVPR